MKVKKIYTSKKVYEGWFEAYFIKPWIMRYADFRDGESERDCRFSLLAWLIVTMGIAGLLMGLVGLLGPEVGFTSMIVVGAIWVAASIIPFIALLTRTFNGHAATPRKPRMLGVDIMLIVSSLLFFLFGMLMMITTLNSEILRPDPGTDEDEENTLPTDTVIEEAVFTYQTPVIDSAAPATDSLDISDDPYAESPDESFDPSLEPNASPDDPVPNDSIYF